MSSLATSLLHRARLRLNLRSPITTARRGLCTAAKMPLKDIQRLELPATADLHVHLRQEGMMELITPQIRKGGVDTVFVMVR